MAIEKQRAAVDKQPAAWGVPAPAENLWPARAAILATIARYATLPDRLTVGPIWLLITLEAALLLVLTILAPVRHTRDLRAQQLLSFGLIALIALANIGSLVLLIAALLHHGVAIQGRPIDGPTLLAASVQIWLTNVLVFGLWYWELDRGGPARRRHALHRQPDFLFPQIVTPACAPGRAPRFVDYLYLSFPTPWRSARATPCRSHPGPSC
jgi:hypothetical protein